MSDAAHHATHDRLHPEPFLLAPQLVGLKFASKRQRLFAILIDLLLVLLLSKLLANAWLLVGLAVGTFVFWRTRRAAASVAWLRGPVTRWALTAASVLVVLGAWAMFRDRHGEEGSRGQARPEERDERIAFRADELGLTVGEMVQLATARDPASAEALARKVAESIGRRSDGPEIAADLLDALDDHALPTSGVSQTALVAALKPVAARAKAPPPPDADPRVTALEQERFTLERRVVRLTADKERLEQRVEALEQEAEEAEKGRGILYYLQHVAHDLGFGVGWSYVYFIGFLVLWRGQTPGKRLLRIRVVRLDGKPFSYWRAFERFHGYAASLLTGLLGFVQVFWDPHRQCLHDKLAETVVVEDAPAARAAMTPPSPAQAA